MAVVTSEKIGWHSLRQAALTLTSSKQVLWSFPFQVDARSILVLCLCCTTDVVFEWVRQQTLAQERTWDTHLHLLACSLLPCLGLTIDTVVWTGVKVQQGNYNAPRALKQIMQTLTVSLSTCSMCLLGFSGGLLASFGDQLHFRCLLALGPMRMRILGLGVVLLWLAKSSTRNNILSTSAIKWFFIGTLSAALAAFGVVVFGASEEWWTESAVSKGDDIIRRTCVAAGLLVFVLVQYVVDWIRSKVFDPLRRNFDKFSNRSSWFCGLLIGHFCFYISGTKNDLMSTSILDKMQSSSTCLILTQGGLWCLIPSFGVGFVTQPLLTSVNSIITSVVVSAMSPSPSRQRADNQTILWVLERFFGVYASILAAASVYFRFAGDTQCAPWLSNNIQMRAGIEHCGVLILILVCTSSVGGLINFKAGLLLLFGLAGGAALLTLLQHDIALRRRAPRTDLRTRTDDTDKYDGSSVCFVCMESPSTFAAIPCGHRALCSACVTAFRSPAKDSKKRRSIIACVVCRTPVRQFCRIYL